MNLVDDVHLSLALAGQELHRLANLSNLFDAIVTGPIDLENVDGCAAVDFDTGRALTTWIGRRARLAVEGLGQNARARRLSDAAAASEQEGMSHSVQFDGIFQGAGNVALPDDFVEGAWAPLTGEDEVRHAVLPLEGSPKKGR